MNWLGRQVGPGGRYHIDEALGAGAAGMVFRGRDARLNRHVVLKILAPQHVMNARIRARFKNEALIQANLVHPNIVRALDSIDDPDSGLLAMVLDLVDGPDLDGYLHSRGGRLELAEAAAIMLPVLDAIQLAHESDVVHRDLKPGNILVDTQRGQMVPKVTDFGVAKLVSDGQQGMTRTGAVLGTPSYMPPEQLKGAKDLDSRADIYALGAILYQLLTGILPHGEGSEYEVTAKVLGGAALPPAADLVPGLPRQVDELLTCAMAFDREHRFQSATVFKRALEQTVAAPQAGHAPPVAHSARSQAVVTDAVHSPTIAEAPGDTGRAEAAVPPTVFESESLYEQSLDRGGTSVGLGATLVVAAVGALVAVGVAIGLLLSGGEVPSGKAEVIVEPPSSDEPPGVAVAPPPQPKPNVFALDMWRLGNLWTYRITRAAAAGVSDESAQLDFTMVRKVKSVVDKGGGQSLVTLESDGGISKPRLRTFIASDKCYLHSRTGETVMCLAGTDADLVPRELSGLKYNVRSVQDVRTQVLFDPQVGPVVEEYTDKKGRVTIRQLVGYRVGNRQAGKVDEAPLTCDWQAKDFKGSRAGTASGTGTATQREAAAFGLSGEIRKYDVPLSGCCGSARFRALRDSTATLFRFHGVDAGPWLIPTPILQLKTWSDSQGTGEYIAMLLEGTDHVVIAIVRLHDGSIQTHAWRFDKAVEPPRYFAIYLTDVGRGCEFQIRRKVAGVIEVALFGVTGQGIQRTGGSLAAAEVSVDDRGRADATLAAIAVRTGDVPVTAGITVTIGRPKSVGALLRAARAGQSILLIGQKQQEVNEPILNDLRGSGTVATIREITEISSGVYQAIFDGQRRGRILSIRDRGSYLEAGISN